MVISLEPTHLYCRSKAYTSHQAHSKHLTTVASTDRITTIMTTTSTDDKPYQILDQPIYHLCEKPLWEEAKDVYYPPTFEQDGNISHAGMHVEKLLGSSNHFYKSSKAEWICLEINPNILLENGIQTMVESPTNVGPTSAERVTIRYPHIYGGISKTIPNLVTKVYPMIRSPDGTFTEIPGVTDQK
jgi:uncharacterized protein (DUF952 family)